MSENEAELSLIASLDRRQDEVLEGIDLLNDRVLETIRDWTGADHCPVDSEPNLETLASNQYDAA